MKAVHSDEAPKAIGPYSQAVAVRGAVFLSGQIGLDPASGQLVQGGVEAEARRVMENLKAVLAAAGLGLSDVVKTTIFLADLNDFTTVNEIYGGYFGDPKPARSTVQVAALPRGARVEIDAIALTDNFE
jgi:2-iminobutanoate/2-iminopropanoate deaminase